jgi:hypothetical protein
MTAETKRLSSHVFGDTFEFVDHSTGLDNSNPEFWIALTFTHSSFGGLFTKRLVGKDPNPDLTATLYVSGECHTTGLDLTTGKPAALGSLQAKVSKGDLAAPIGQPPHLSLLPLAILDSLWTEHWISPLPGREISKR